MINFLPTILDSWHPPSLQILTLSIYTPSSLLSLYEEEIDLRLQDFPPSSICASFREYLPYHIKKFNMDSKVPLLSPFNYDDWNPKMSAIVEEAMSF